MRLMLKLPDIASDIDSGAAEIAAMTKEFKRETSVEERVYRATQIESK